MYRGEPTTTIIDIIQDTCQNASTRIHTAQGTTDKILWRKGAKQGCPLSPLLFHLCLELLFETLKTKNREDGVIRWIDNNKVKIQAQTYADDIILIAEDQLSMETLIQTTERFLKWSQMEVSAKKCFLASYVSDENGHRASIASIQLKSRTRNRNSPNTQPEILPTLL